MNDSPSGYLDLTHLTKDVGFHDMYVDSQNREMLLRNNTYMNEVATIRKKYSIDIASDDPELALSSADLRQAFDDDIRKLSDKIRCSGDWFYGVRDHVLGFDTELGLHSFPDKKVLVKSHHDNIELKIYGDVTKAELNNTLNEVRSMIRKNVRGREIKAKSKNSQSDNLIIYDLWKAGKTAEQIVVYCAENGIEKILTPEDVRKYVYHTEKQIQEIVA